VSPGSVRSAAVLRCCNREVSEWPSTFATVNTPSAVPSPAPRIRLTINSKGGDDFDAQRELIKSTGAKWDPEAKGWRLWLGADLARDAEALTTLFKAARAYGTTVKAGAMPTGG
jgi:hypothetical protein